MFRRLSYHVTLSHPAGPLNERVIGESENASPVLLPGGHTVGANFFINVSIVMTR